MAGIGHGPLKKKKKKNLVLRPIKQKSYYEQPPKWMNFGNWESRHYLKAGCGA
jgi:hypothetical protein